VNGTRRRGLVAGANRRPRLPSKRVWRAIQAAGPSGSGADPWREPPAVFDALPIRGRTDEPEAVDI